MIIYKDKSSYMYNSEIPNDNFGLDKELIFMIDDINQLKLSEKIRSNFPNIDFVLDSNDNLVDATVLNKPAPKSDIELLREENIKLWDTVRFLLEAGGYIPSEGVVK